MNNKKASSAVIYVTIIIIFSKLLGFIKQMITAHFYGATIETDLISISEGLITNIDYLLVQILTTAFVPTYIHSKKNNDNKDKRFVANTILVFLSVSVLISTLIFFTAPLISKILAPTYPDIYLVKLSYYIKIVSPTLNALVIAALFNSLLKGNESFVPGELISVIHSIIPILLIFILGKLCGPDTLVYSFILYAVISLVFLALYSKKYWNLKFSYPFKDENVKKLLHMTGPLLLGYSIVFINQQVDKIIVSGLGDGVVTAMGYASVLSNFICTFIGSVSGVLFVYITKRIAENKHDDAADFLINSTGQMLTVVLPILVLTVFNSKDIVTVVFGRGKFDDDAIETCSYALIGYGLMFIPYVFREIFSRFQYGYGDSKHPMINSSIGIVFNIIASIILSKFIGVLGVTIATSLSVLICGVLNIYSSLKINRMIKLISLRKLLVPWLLGGALCALFSFVGNKILADINVFIRLFIIVFFSMLFYFIINYKIIMNMIKTVLSKKAISNKNR